MPERVQTCLDYDLVMATREIAGDIPYIQWPHNWLVKAVPPFSGAVIRYYVTKHDSERPVSIYLDWYDILGCVGEPYWEVYPYNDDTFRCAMADIKALKNAIRISLMQLRRKTDA